MTSEKRDVIIEAADILRLLSGNNGMCNMQKKQKQVMAETARKLRQIVEDDIKSEPERMPDPEFMDEILTHKIPDMVNE